MTIEELRLELENIIASLNASGFGAVEAGIGETLDKLAASAAELGMNQGKQLLDNLSAVIKAIQEGKSGEGSGSIRLQALEFYIKQLAGSGGIEDL